MKTPFQKASLTQLIALVVNRNFGFHINNYTRKNTLVYQCFGFDN